MNMFLMIAAGLMIAVGGAHSYLGERYILIRLFRRENLPALFGGSAFTKRTLRLAWHITTVFALGIAALLIMLASGPLSARAVAEVIAITCAASGMVSLVISRGTHLSWIAFFAIAILTWIGT